MRNPFIAVYFKGTSVGNLQTRSVREILITILGIGICLFTLAEINLNWMQPQASLALFTLFGMLACFIELACQPAKAKNADSAPLTWRDRWHGPIHWVLAVASALCFGYIVIQTEPWARGWWWNGTSLGNRVAQETMVDYAIGLIGLLLVLYATGRTIGWIVPGLALALCLHSWYCFGSSQYGWPELPSWLLPHRGQGLKDLVSTTFLQSQGVLGQAMAVMFRYVFLFIVFGALLEMSGATEFIIEFSKRVFGRSTGGPAKMAVLASGMMGSLSGSAVANAVTTGAFTIPMMKNDGFKPHDAAAVEAAAGSGGALVPPVMGAGAYMMLEFIQPAVSFTDIAMAALIPSLLYYFSLFMSVHFYAQRHAKNKPIAELDPKGNTSLIRYEGLVFFAGLGSLILLLILGVSPFRAVTGATVLIMLLVLWRKQMPLTLPTRLLGTLVFFAVAIVHQWYLRNQTDFFELSASGGRQFEAILNSAMLAMSALIVFALVHPQWRGEMYEAMRKSIRNGIPLITAAACVGIIIGVVQQSGIANDFSSAMRGVVEQSLFLALCGIMVSSIILGMGVPSVVCYLLIATIMGSLLENLGVPGLAAHMFIFYFGMMSMVTPPVALAAYAAASIAGANPMLASWSAFRLSLVGFTLPFMFVYRPELLLISPTGGPLQGIDVTNLIIGLVASVIGLIALAAALQGFFRKPLSWSIRGLFLASSFLLIAPNVGGRNLGIVINLCGVALFALLVWQLRVQTPSQPTTADQV